jgi:Mce-associated membrane protein
MGWIGFTSVFVLLAVALGFFGTRFYTRHQQQERYDEVVYIARQLVVNITSLDYQKFDADVQRVVDGATPEFGKEFSSRAQAMKQAIVANKAVSTSQVLEAGVVSANKSAAQVLAVVDSQVKNAAAPNGQPRNYRMRMDLIRSNGRWLVKNLAFVA